jgi:hypothetical protein
MRENSSRANLVEECGACLSVQPLHNVGGANARYLGGKKLVKYRVANHPRSRPLRVQRGLGSKAECFWRSETLFDLQGLAWV